ncbi:MAG: heme lyase CcmF/NrfE family subunit [Pseudomonadota bacterium]
MIPELGQFVLILALMMACLQALAPMVGASRGDAALAGAARSLAIAQFILIALAFVALSWAHAQSDFSVANVVANSHSAKPFVYKLTGVWGNHEGSMLLWVLILAGFGGVLASGVSEDKLLQARTLSIQGAVAAAFLAFVIFTSNPFARIFPAPADGMDLNPLLQDPGLIIHPPFLYLGYVGFSIVFAFAVAGLISGKVDQAWARAVRPWALAAWVFLTIGITLGSWWAYYELGWGGFWAWDPVENASFMPWLAGTAFIHSVRVLEKRGALKVWTILLAISAFSLSLIGTFLVRSGILTSVHAFAVDPERGVFILAILGLVIGGSLMLFALRAPLLTSKAGFAPVSREGAILANNILMSVSCITVFVGTFYPLFYEIVSGGKLSVGAPYFNATFLPLMGILFFIIAPAAMLSWKRDTIRPALMRLWPAAVVAVFLLALALFLTWPKHVAAAFGAGLAGWTMIGVIIDLARRTSVRASGLGGALKKLIDLPRPYLGMSAAHFGIAILAIGVLGAGVWRTEEILFMKPGETISVGGYDIVLKQIAEREGPNFLSETARFDVNKDGATLRMLDAERRYYPVRGMQTTEAGIWTSLRGDLYLTIGAPNENAGHAVRAWYNPFAVWLWIGGGLIAFGGVIAALPRPAPRSRRQKRPELAEAHG